MKQSILLPILLAVIVGGLFIFINYQKQEKQSGKMIVSEDRTIEGCLVSDGYSFNDEVGACIREGEMTPNIMEASRKAVEYVGEGYALTIVSFNSYEEQGSYDILLERSDENTQGWVYIRGDEVVPALIPEENETVDFN